MNPKTKYVMFFAVPFEMDNEPSVVASNQNAQKAGLWHDFSNATRPIPRSGESDKRLPPHCWLLPLAGGLQNLCTLVHAATVSHVEYRVLLLDDAPQWLE